MNRKKNDRETESEREKGRWREIKTETERIKSWSQRCKNQGKSQRRRAAKQSDTVIQKERR